MIELQKIFEVKYGVNLELNKLEEDLNGINFVSRTAKNNGVSAKVKSIEGIQPIEAGVLSVAGGGSVLETFLQPEPFYSGRDLYYLKPKIKMTDTQKLFYCACIRANKYKYSYGRQANRTLKNLLVPSIEEIPGWINSTDLEKFNGARNSLVSDKLLIETENWQSFYFGELFNIKKGKRLTKANMVSGDCPFIGATDNKNGLTAKIGQNPIHSENVITVNYNGSVGEAFYQPFPFWASDDVNVLYPKTDKFKFFNQYVALFIIPLIKLNKFRFSYGRKWHKERMEVTIIKLPVDINKLPDIKFMEKYIKSLPYSAYI